MLIKTKGKKPTQIFAAFGSGTVSKHCCLEQSPNIPRLMPHFSLLWDVTQHFLLQETFLSCGHLNYIQNKQFFQLLSQVFKRFKTVSRILPVSYFSKCMITLSFGFCFSSDFIKPAQLNGSLHVFRSGDLYRETEVSGISISSSSSNVQQTRWDCSITCQRTTKSLWTSLCEN